MPGGGDGSYPQLVIPPGSTHCGSHFIVSGTGFEPNEHVTLIVSTSDAIYPAPANADGKFNARIPMPAELCGRALGEVRAYQPGFEQYGRPLTSTYFAPLGEPPGPPNLGNTPPSTQHPILWLHITALVALVLGASLLVTRR